MRSRGQNGTQEPLGQFSARADFGQVLSLCISLFPSSDWV